MRVLSGTAAGTGELATARDRQVDALAYGEGQSVELLAGYDDVVVVVDVDREGLESEQGTIASIGTDFEGVGDIILGLKWRRRKIES